MGTVAFTHGREAASQYNETLAGARIPTPGPGKIPSVHVNALRADGTLLKYVQNLTELAAPGEADDSLMAFQVTTDSGPRGVGLRLGLECHVALVCMG